MSHRVPILVVGNGYDVVEDEYDIDGLIRFIDNEDYDKICEIMNVGKGKSRCDFMWYYLYDLCVQKNNIELLHKIHDKQDINTVYKKYNNFREIQHCNEKFINVYFDLIILDDYGTTRAFD